MNIQSLPLFVYLAVKAMEFDTATEFKDFLLKNGWEYLANGSYKTVYHKKGVPFVIKFTNGYYGTNHGGEGSVLEEFNMSRIFRGLEYLFSHGYKNQSGQISDAIGFQPRVVVTGRDFQDKKYTSHSRKNRRFDVYRHVISQRFSVFNEKTGKVKGWSENIDCREANIGLDMMGRWVQFD